MANSKTQKIQVVGITGVGKTYLSKKISEKHNFKYVCLDDILYIKKYTQKRDRKERLKIIKNHLENKRSIILDGTWLDYDKKLYKKPDLIMIVKSSFLLNLLNLFLRKEKSGIFNLLKNIHLLFKSKFNKKLKAQIEEHNNYIKKYAKKYIIIDNSSKKS